MATMIDDSKKQKLIDKLLEEPPMVLATAYAFAKNYVNNGIDITKAWTTAVQQASILEQAYKKGFYEGLEKAHSDKPSGKWEYDNPYELFSFRCSNCGCYKVFANVKDKYCSCCGAKMDGKEQTDEADN